MPHITTSIVGTLVAGYGTPAASSIAIRYIGLPDMPVASVEGMMGFVLGLNGMSLCEAVMPWARAWRDGPPPVPPRVS